MPTRETVHRYRIVSQPPVVVPARDLAATYGISRGEIGQVIREQFRAYRATLQLDRRNLAYADQNERDFEDFTTAIRSGRLEAREGV